MLKLKKIAVTGGISSGKSTFCQYLKELGAETINADTVVHRLLSPNTILGLQVIDLLGPDIVKNDRIDRSIVASKVFSDYKLLDQLEGLLHPAVFRETERLYQEAVQQAFSLFVAEIPLLFEAKKETDFDTTIAVIADETLCLRRFLAKGFNERDYELRAKHQLPQQEKAKRANIAIYNNGSIKELKKAAEFYYHQLVS
ncbi:dephospho-CoA kinase [Criblamydia sequanensis]|uniref:Dephospho-CoA kinase n=1 Tax=Candidatus Criblamydia sequanensis CRIB-18 TaxID=1437425 RepID=A0A090D014_9BACT|nr:dephospho-CoA kinase [Criblamydia sequanensis]CDR34787.1 Dephospho-CoA kinase [Criblamydia sequanensis CRIB-18]